MQVLRAFDAVLFIEQPAAEREHALLRLTGMAQDLPRATHRAPTTTTPCTSPRRTADSVHRVWRRTCRTRPTVGSRSWHACESRVGARLATRPACERWASLCASNSS